VVAGCVHHAIVFMGQFLKKVDRRIKYYKNFIIPFNIRYKIQGVHPTIEEFLYENPDQGNYMEIFPKHISRLDIDENFFNACPPYLTPKMEVEQSASFILSVKNGRVISGPLGRNIAYISSDNHLIGEVSFQWSNDKLLPPHKNNILNYRYFEQPKKFDGRVFSMLSGAAGEFNYFHWFIDTLPKLYMARKANLLETLDWFLVPAFKYSFQKEYLQLLGIDESKIIRGDKVRHILAEELIVPSATRGTNIHIPEWICQFYRNEILPEAAGDIKPTNRIYISRNDSQKRRVLNERDLLPVLEKHGFEIHQLGNKSTEEQIRLFASANFVVAPHGAGLANLIYCAPGTKVLEFFPGGYVKQTFYDLSNKCNLDYRYVICQKDQEATNSIEGQKIHITVNVEEIDRNIQAWDDHKVNAMDT
jgi:capsular polysaccharide biosynthesis protein